MQKLKTGDRVKVKKGFDKSASKSSMLHWKNCPFKFDGIEFIIEAGQLLGNKACYLPVKGKTTHQLYTASSSHLEKVYPLKGWGFGR